MGFRTTGEAMGRRAAAYALALALCACVDKSDLPRPVVQADAAAGLLCFLAQGLADRFDEAFAQAFRVDPVFRAIDEAHAKREFAGFRRQQHG